jgi:hypothetical protein
MGRFLDFSTSFYYKMVFGIQSTKDINYFCGKITGGNYDIEMFYCVWNIENISDILEKIKKLKNDFDINFNLEDLENTEKDVDGTLKVYRNILQIINYNDENHVRFMFGCIIYHQLLYNNFLYATLYL